MFRSSSARTRSATPLTISAPTFGKRKRSEATPGLRRGLVAGWCCGSRNRHEKNSLQVGNEQRDVVGVKKKAELLELGPKHPDR
jgi:hypothetical protein